MLDASPIAAPPEANRCNSNKDCTIVLSCPHGEPKAVNKNFLSHFANRCGTEKGTVVGHDCNECGICSKTLLRNYGDDGMGYFFGQNYEPFIIFRQDVTHRWTSGDGGSPSKPYSECKMLSARCKKSSAQSPNQCTLYHLAVSIGSAGITNETNSGNRGAIQCKETFLKRWRESHKNYLKQQPDACLLDKNRNHEDFKDLCDQILKPYLKENLDYCNQKTLRPEIKALCLKILNEDKTSAPAPAAPASGGGGPRGAQ